MSLEKEIYYDLMCMFYCELLDDLHFQSASSIHVLMQSLFHVVYDGISDKISRNQ